MQSQARLNYAERSQPKRLCLKDTAGVTKNLAESERRQLHPSFLRREGLVRMWSFLWEGFLSPTRGTEGVVKTIETEGFEKNLM